MREREREWEIESETGGDYHSFVTPIKQAIFFFFFFFLFSSFFCRLRRIMTRKFKVTSARRLFTMKFDRLDLFFLSALYEEGWNKREFDFCSNTWNEEKRVEKLKIFYFLPLTFSFILKIPTKIKSILIPSFLYTRFSLLDRFSFTMTMLRWECVLRVHGRLCHYLQKMRIFIPCIPTLPSGLYRVGDKRWERVISVLFFFLMKKRMIGWYW